MDWFKNTKRASFEFPELERKLANNRHMVKTEGEKLSRKSSEILHHKDVTDKIADIKLRNKVRTILVIGECGNEAPVVVSLLQLNSKARPTFVKDLGCAVIALKESCYDMIYIVVRTEMGVKNGPCFFSMNEGTHVSNYGHVVKKELIEMRPWLNGSEIFVIRGHKTKDRQI